MSIAVYLDNVVARTSKTQAIIQNFGQIRFLPDIKHKNDKEFDMIIQSLKQNLALMYSCGISKNDTKKASIDVVEALWKIILPYLNISKHPYRLELLKSMCISYPTKGQDYSVLFRMHQFHMRGCRFQTFFALMNLVFRFYDNHPIKGEVLESLFKILSNLNALAYNLLVNGTDILFLIPREDHSLFLLTILFIQFIYPE